MSSDREAGFTRRRRGKGWQFIDWHGRTVTDPATRERLEGLVIPPAWRNVWICRSRWGHLQATGVDAAGRKQYLYHPRWREERDRAKHDRVLRFADALPGLRRQVDAHLRRPGLDREKALAAAVRLLDRTGIRVGGERYAEEAGTYGLATLRSKHLSVDGGSIVIDFTAKGGVDHRVEVDDARLARVVAEMDALPGYEVLKYRGEDGSLVDVRSRDVNAYIKQFSGDEYTAKDFRTWAGTVAAALALDALREVPTGRRRERAVAAACRIAADELGNTPAVCRRSYVDPRVLEHYLAGVTVSDIGDQELPAAERGRSRDERYVLALLRRTAPGHEEEADRAIARAA
jgi:DNA topoisomerase I